jgi:Trk K+ transport system NAD-binding subunit
MYNSVKDMNIIESQIVQREFDGRWERIVKVIDTENQYTYKNESGITVSLIPEKWITVQVYDFVMEAV